MFTDPIHTQYTYEKDEVSRSEEPAATPARADGRAKIKVIGVGGAGNNAVNRMIEAGITSAEYIAVNTDAQILACSKATTRIQIGKNLTKGLGAGADPEQGREAAEEDRDELIKAIEDTDLLFITAGMGGGTGTGAAPVIAKLARDRRILTVAVVTQPFSFEGKHRMDNAKKGIEELKKHVDTIVIIPNDKIRDIVPKNASISEALRVADDVLKQGIRGIADIIVTPSIINLDFADVKTILKDKGLAHMGVGVAKGENRIVTAVRVAVNSPLLETTIEGAKAVLINITGGNDLTLEETQTAVGLVQSVVDYSANIIFGTCIDENMQDEVQVTVIATGFQTKEAQDVFAEAALRRDEPIPDPDFLPKDQEFASVAQEPAAQSVGPMPQPQPPVWGPSPVPAPVSAVPTAHAAPVAPVAPAAHEETAMSDAQDDDLSEEQEEHSNMPQFLQYLLGKKKK